MADKKITELPFIDTLSGSLVGDNTPIQNTVIPVVLRGTTNQINIENFSKFVNAYSAHTGSAGNIFTGPQTINNNVTINGRLTVNEVVAQYETASILFSTGSTKLGDQLTDKHEFTGSTNITGSVFYNNVLLTNIDANTIHKLQQTTRVFLNTQTGSQELINLGISSVTGALNTTTSSFDSVFLRISSVTGSINTTTSSFDSVFLRISSTTGSINTTTSSFDSVFLRISSTTGSINTTTSSFNSVFLGISSVTGAINTQSSSQDLVNRQISLVTGSIHFVTGAFNSFSASIIGQTNTISTFTSSVNFATQSLNTQTGSQDLVNRGISSVTGSINTTTSSFDSVFLRISSTTGSINTTTSSFDLVFRGISSVTGAINTQSSSQDLVNLGVSIATGSLIGITNGLMAFTAALDNTYATDAQLYQLYQATASLNTQTGSQDLVNRAISSTTGSINTTTSSFDGVFLRISSTTGSINTTTSSFDGVFLRISSTTGSINTTTSSFNNVFLGISSVTGAINTQSSSQDLVNLGISSVTGSLIGITNGLMAFTAALDTTYATDAQLYQLYQATASIHFTTQSLNTQTGSQDLVNLDISTFTGSLRSEVNLIEAYTASLKAAEIVSASQQITNYYKFAETASANTFYGIQTISGSLRISSSLRTNIITGGLDVNGGITGSFKGNLVGVADYASTIVVVNTGTTTDTTLYPTFTTSPILAQYTSLYSHASSSFFYNGVTRRLHMEGFVVSGSNNNVEISGSFNVSGSTNLTGSITINESRIDNGWTAYTPQWTAASVNPVINNGTIEGYYKVIGKTCFVRGNIAMGSTTTFGTGEWYVSLPFTASNADAILMTATLLDNGSGWYNATMAGARAGFNHKAPIQYQSAGGTANDINATQPFTWANTDRFMWNGSYEIA